MQLVVANKNDLNGASDQFKELKMKVKNKHLISISALKKQNIDLLKELIFQNLKKFKCLTQKKINKQVCESINITNAQNNLLNTEFTFVNNGDN